VAAAPSEVVPPDAGIVLGHGVGHDVVVFALLPPPPLLSSLPAPAPPPTPPPPPPTFGGGATMGSKGGGGAPIMLCMSNAIAAAITTKVLMLETQTRRFSQYAFHRTYSRLPAFVTARRSTLLALVNA